MNEDEHSNKKNDEQSRAGIVHAMSINVFCLNSDQEHQSLFFPFRVDFFRREEWVNIRLPTSWVQECREDWIRVFDLVLKLESSKLQKKF